MRLPAELSSPQDLSALEFELRNYSQWFSHNSIKHTVGAERGATKLPVLSPMALAMVREQSTGQLLDQHHLDKLIEELATFRSHAPTMTITLAAPANNEIKQALVEWCRTNLNESVLVSFRFNATLLGGMVVRYGSHVFDWSFKRKILQNRSHFPEVLRSV